MYGTHDIIRNRISPPDPISLDELRQSEWSEAFERLMRNRLVMGALRYGRLGAAQKPRYDRVGAICKRINEYSKTGNLELLVDVANLALLEFEEGRHPKRHFSPVDDGEHVGLLKKGET